MKTLIPKKFCLSCDVCCRFLDSNSSMRPTFLNKEQKTKFKSRLNGEGRVILKKQGNLYICPFFILEKNMCSIYRQRPFDCKLYPFVICYDENKNRIVLGIDKKCPFVSTALKNSLKLIELLENKKFTEEILKTPKLISSFDLDYIPIAKLNRLTTRIIFNPQRNGYKKLRLEDKNFFDEHFNGSQNASHSFVNLYIWKDIMDVWWKKTDSKLDILLEQGGNLIKFDKLKRFKEYIYLRKGLAELKGNRFKHKRSSYNFFVKNYQYQYLAYRKAMRDECLKLFSKWARQRKQKYHDPYYQKLIDDSFYAQKTAMEEFDSLGLCGRVVKIGPVRNLKRETGYFMRNSSKISNGVGGRILAYTFGLELNKDTFCILFETTDLNIKGLSQFIFREFCKELPQYKYINLMDDSGLENLRRVKESYRPI